MRRFVFLFCFIFVLTGCRTLNTPSALRRTALASASVGQGSAPLLLPHGVVFAKTVFEGVVKKSYVRLSFINEADPSEINHLFIGDPVRQRSFPVILQTVNPDYFIIELPTGNYRFTELAVPVGTSLAAEPMDVSFSVPSASANYLGTLRVRGTRERVRLGGVPLVRPGFDYTIQILDERAEAMAEFHRRVPQFSSKINVGLMRAHALPTTATF